jgi:heme-degrading monooxygenase HmoA
MIPGFATTPEPPYYAVIFTSKRTDGDHGYNAMMDVIVPLSTAQAGYLGRESARLDNGFGITVIYYKDEASILAWKNQEKHLVAQKLGKQRWYEHYEMRVCKVERAYSGPEGR